MTTCGECANARFQLTPTGRFKKGVAGRCGKQNQMADMIPRRLAPCLVVQTPLKLAIWPEYDANGCPMFAAKEQA
jgi:hypothetical protein